jgi:hypothetical protein
MPVVFTAGNSAVSAKASDLILSALLEANILSPGEGVPGDQSAWLLEKLQRLIDLFNAKSELIYNVTFGRFTLQANHSPHTIGPAGDFNVTQRPVRIISAALVLTGSTVIDIPLNVRDEDWWAGQAIKGSSSTLPTDVFYSLDNPLGQLNFWPVPSSVNDVRLEYWTNLTQAVDMNTSIAMPPAYWEALVLKLAVSLCPSYEKEPSVALIANAREAMMAIKSNNSSSPRMSTRQAGMPRSNAQTSVRPGFNFLTGGRN